MVRFAVVLWRAARCLTEQAGVSGNRAAVRTSTAWAGQKARLAQTSVS